MPEFLTTLWRKTLNSVLFGIGLMALVAAYIAIGSGLPSVREAFEMNELEFFGAWPLKLLMGLLVLNLATVTWTRIPFTPPRYGVWTIHAGIITLIAGMSFYYSRKTEGLTRLYTDAHLGSASSDYYYHATERSLYVGGAKGQLWTIYRLNDLPRYKEHEQLNRAGLRDIRPTVRRGERETNVKELLGLGDDVAIDITGYWPYASIATSYREDASGGGGVPGIHVTVPAGEDAPEQQTWLISSDVRSNLSIIANNEIQHIHLPDSSAIETLRKAAGQTHQITARIGGKDQSLAAEIGKSYLVGRYTLAIESFNPAWPMSGTGEVVKALTLTVKSPTQQFRRMILDGKELQTDFKLDDPSGGPMGKRQKEPLDNDLVLHYRFTDPFRLLPRRGSVKHLIITTAGAKGLAVITTGLAQAAQFKDFPDGTGELQLASAELNAPFLKAMGVLPDGSKHPSITLKLERKDHVLRDESVEVVPPVKRESAFDEMGVFQVVRARVRSGSFSRDVLVPFAQDAGETPWEGGTVELPGGGVIQLQLGNTRLEMPARLTLSKFELVPYRGGEPGEDSMMRDFRSTLRVLDRKSGEESTAVAHMNHPVYFAGGSWLFYQAQFDPQQRWTVLGVGNRPGVATMITGCVMMAVGLMYAFYLKPVIVRRMKEKALAQAQARKRQPELVGA